MTEKTLDAKLARLKQNLHSGDFIIADAKDADMAFGIAAPGKSPEMHAHEGKFRSLADYRQCIRDVVHQGLVDIMLMSAHTSGLLTIEEGLFENSPVTPAARANDTTDIHVVRGAAYIQQPSQPFQSTTIDHIQCGHLDCRPEERARGVNLGLYSVTFNNDLAADKATLEAYKSFRIEAERKGFRHFLEVFDPNRPAHAIAPDKLGGFINDMIVRSLAGVPEAGRPLFLKMVYHGPKYTEELASYDPQLIIGVLGGSSGTTYDAFKLIAEAQKYGARVALFGRKINNAEHQLAFVAMLRKIVDGAVTPEEAVHAYHGVLEHLKIKPYRALADDMQLTDSSMSYAGGSRVHVPAAPNRERGAGSRAQGTGRPTAPERTRGAEAERSSKREVKRANADARGSGHRPAAGRNGRPDFAQMSSAERLAYHKQRLAGVGRP